MPSASYTWKKLHQHNCTSNCRGAGENALPGKDGFEAAVCMALMVVATAVVATAAAATAAAVIVAAAVAAAATAVVGAVVAAVVVAVAAFVAVAVAAALGRLERLMQMLLAMKPVKAFLLSWMLDLSWFTNCPHDLLTVTCNVLMLQCRPLYFVASSKHLYTDSTSQLSGTDC